MSQFNTALENREHPGFVGHSAAMASLQEIIDGVAQRRCTVMILGETGAGKEVVANRIHCLSDRAEKRFIPVNCSALSEGLFESELFGHAKGAFTGALRDSLGIIRAADGGTLFLDEIGEMSLPLQAKLLRVIQERRVTPVGDTKSYPVDVRIVCATNRDLQAMVRQGTFREDLFFRLNVVVIQVAPLRDRLEDVADLAAHFLRAQADLYDEPLKHLAPESATMLQNYDWPGNVRELANAMEYAYAMARQETIEPRHLPAHLVNELRERRRPTIPTTLAAIERQAISEALAHAQYCKAAAGRALGIPVKRLSRFIERFKIPMAVTS